MHSTACGHAKRPSAAASAHPAATGTAAAASVRKRAAAKKARRLFMHIGFTDMAKIYGNRTLFPDFVAPSRSRLSTRCVRPSEHSSPSDKPDPGNSILLSGSAGVEASGWQRNGRTMPGKQADGETDCPILAETCGRSICRELSAADTPLRETSGYRSQSGIRRIDVRPTVQQVRGRAAQMVPGLPASALSSALTSGRESGQAAI